MTEERVNIDGISENHKTAVLLLISLGAKQDTDVNRAFWLNGHCFYVHPDKGIIEL